MDYAKQPRGPLGMKFNESFNDFLWRGDVGVVRTFGEP